MTAEGAEVCACGWQIGRARAAVDRLHAAQVAALAEVAKAPGVGSVVEVYGAQRRLLEQAAEVGMLVAGLGAAGAAAPEMRRQLVARAAESATTLALLVPLAFEVGDDDAGEWAGGGGDGGGGCREAPGAGRRGWACEERMPTSLRVVTDCSLLLVEELKVLVEHPEQQMAWRRQEPAELWSGLLRAVAALFPLVARRPPGALSQGELRQMWRLTAEVSIAAALLRFYPRFPTA